jgi:hypothetical protein
MRSASFEAPERSRSIPGEHGRGAHLNWHDFSETSQDQGVPGGLAYIFPVKNRTASQNRSIILLDCGETAKRAYPIRTNKWSGRGPPGLNSDGPLQNHLEMRGFRSKRPLMTALAPAPTPGRPLEGPFDRKPLRNESISSAPGVSFLVPVNFWGPGAETPFFPLLAWGLNFLVRFIFEGYGVMPVWDARPSVCSYGRVRRTLLVWTACRRSGAFRRRTGP